MFACFVVWMLNFVMYIYFKQNCVINFNNLFLKEIQAHDKQLGNSLSTTLTFFRTKWLGLHTLGSFLQFHCTLLFFFCKFAHWMTWNSHSRPFSSSLFLAQERSCHIPYNFKGGTRKEVWWKAGGKKRKEVRGEKNLNITITQQHKKTRTVAYYAKNYQKCC